MNMINEGFYNNANKYDFNRSLKRYNISEEDQKLIQDYLNEKQAIDHISDTRARKIGFTLIGWSRFITKPWRDVTLSDVLAGITTMKKSRAIRFWSNGETYDGGPLSKSTQYDFVVILKPYLLWLQETGIIKISEKDIVKKIKPPKLADPTERIKSSDILTFDEVQKIIDAALTIRDRAILSVLYESGARVGEIGRATWEDAIFDEYGIKFYIVDTKTNKRRYSRLTISNAALSTLKDKHPTPYGNNFIFLNPDGTPMTYIGIKRVLDRAISRSGITKKVTPHMLRHARATHMVQQNYNESTIKKSLWNNLNSKMFQTYVSLGEQDIDREFLKQAGVKVQDESEKAEKMKSPTCGRCHFVNAPGAQFCNKCGNPLTNRAAGDQDDLMNHLYKQMATNPQVAEAIRIISEAALKNKA